MTASIGTYDRLIKEVLDLIPKYTGRRGSFNTVPGLGYDARHPGEWQREFVGILDAQYLDVFSPDTNDIVALMEFLNRWPTSPLVHASDCNGSRYAVPAGTLSSILGYALLEMVVRKLLPKTELDRGPSSLEKLLRRFERETSLRNLASGFRSLNSQMTYQQEGKNVNLYSRLKQGRDELMHGNVLRMHESEGLLLVLLVDLVALHVMRDKAGAKVR